MEGEQVVEIPVAEGQDEENWRDMFTEFDTDGSGELDREEVRQIMFILQKNPTDEELVEFMKEIDKDSDQKISFEEFCTIMKKQPDASAEMKDILKNFDKNGDGFLDREELIEILSQDPDFNREDPEFIELIEGSADENQDGKISIDEYVRLLQC